jgi:hypothetical protein
MPRRGSVVAAPVAPEKELVDLSWAEAEINAWNRAGHTLVTLGTLTRGASQSQGISEIE